MTQQLNTFSGTNILEISGNPKELFKQFTLIATGEQRRTTSVKRIKLFFALALLSFPFGSAIISFIMRIIGKYDLYLQYNFVPFTINLAILFSVLGFHQIYRFYKTKRNKVHSDFRTKVIPFLTKLVNQFNVKEFKNIKIDLRPYEEKNIGEESVLKEKSYPDLRHWEYQDDWFSGTVVLQDEIEIGWTIEINLHKTDRLFRSSEGDKSRVESITTQRVTSHNETTEKEVKVTVMGFDYKRMFDSESLFNLIKEAKKSS